MMKSFSLAIATIVTLVSASLGQNSPPPASGQAEYRAPAPPKDCFIEHAHNGEIHTVCVTLDNFLIISGGADGKIRTWHRKTRKPYSEIEKGFAPARHFAISPDSKYLYAAVPVESPIRDGKRTIETDVWMWHPENHLVWGRFVVKPGIISSLAVSPDGKWLATTEDGPIVRLWDTAAGRESKQLYHSHLNGPIDVKEIITGTAFSPDGKLLATWGRSSRFLRLWDVNSGHEQKRFDMRTSWLVRVVFSSDGRNVFAIAAHGAEPMACEIASGHLGYFKMMVVGGAETPHHAITDLAISPDSRLLVSAGSEGTIRLWEIAIRREVERIGVDANSLAFTANGRTVIAGRKDGSILFWDWAKRKPGDAGGQLIETSDTSVSLAWKSLADSGAANGQAATRVLICNPIAAVRTLNENLKPIPRPAKGAIAKLVDGLGAEQFADRERAARELASYREAIREDLNSAATNHKSAEVRQRCRMMLVALDLPFDAERLRYKRAIQALEAIGSPEAIKVLEKLAQGTSGVAETEDAITAMKRLRKN